MIELFTLEKGKVVPTIHCETIEWLKIFKSTYPKTYIKLYEYLFYMTCPDPKLNPYHNISKDNKSSLICSDIGFTDSLDDTDIDTAMEKLRNLYETRTIKYYLANCIAIDKVIEYLTNLPEITDGKEGNISGVRSMLKDFNEIRKSFKQTEADFLEEIAIAKKRGGGDKAYDL